MNFKGILIISSAFALMVLVNILIYKVIVRRTLKKVIKPYFKTLGYTIEKAEFPGLFRHGDFPSPEIIIGGPIADMGSPFNSTFVYLFLKPIENGKPIVRITARIKTVFFSLRKVEYSKALPNLIK